MLDHKKAVLNQLEHDNQHAAAEAVSQAIDENVFFHRQ